uniref:Uncharacterized protein n=1 Tax=Anguilla anguilla TaxID=7936 RepID=A0A0E9RU30_ANGAN
MSGKNEILLVNRAVALLGILAKLYCLHISCYYIGCNYETYLWVTDTIEHSMISN